MLFFSASMLLAVAVPRAQEPADPDAILALERARRGQFADGFTAAVICVRESFLGGRDTLRGVLESEPARGIRRLWLAGAGGAFEWWSREGGQEQWRRDGTGGRIRRLPPHSLRKPSFAPEVSFEDLLRLPFGPLEGSRSARVAGQTDSTITLSVEPGPRLALLYGGLLVTLDRAPAALRGVVFQGSGERPSKTLEVVRYLRHPEGLFPVEIIFRAGDGLSSTRLIFEPVADGPARDKVQAPELSPPEFAEPRWLPWEAGSGR